MIIINNSNRTNYNKIKRGIDVIASGCLIAFGFPLLLLISLLILIIDKQNPIFIQVRTGLYGKPFRIYKFSTMKTSQDLVVQLKSVTKLGSFLRNYSIDELPQLLNVLKGEMSLVGPRPLPINYLPLYSTKQMARHQVRPGITGLAQTSGRNGLDWDAKFDLDIRYVENLSFIVDLKIIVKTFKVILTSQNVNASDSIIMNPFSPVHPSSTC